MATIIVRDVPERLAELLSQQAKSVGMSREAWLREKLGDLVFGAGTGFLPDEEQIHRELAEVHRDREFWQRPVVPERSAAGGIKARDHDVEAVLVAARAASPGAVAGQVRFLRENSSRDVYLRALLELDWELMFHAYKSRAWRSVPDFRCAPMVLDDLLRALGYAMAQLAAHAPADAYGYLIEKLELFLAVSLAYAERGARPPGLVDDAESTKS